MEKNRAMVNWVRACLLGSAVCLASCSDGGTYTLYRDSPVSTAMRVHVASFNTSDGESYNKENCQLAEQLFQKQPGVTVKFWCEKGTFRK